MASFFVPSAFLSISVSCLILFASGSFGKVAISSENNGKYSLCKSDISAYSIALNRTNYQEAEKSCKAFGKSLAVLDGVNDLLHVAHLMYECAIAAGETLSTAWVMPKQLSLQVNEDSVCMAVDSLGGLISGSPALCGLNMNIHVLCKSDPPSEVPSETEGESTIPSSEEVASSETSEGVSRPLKIEKFTEPMAISKIISEFQKDRYRKNQPTKIQKGIVNINQDSEDMSTSTPTPPCNPWDSSSSCETCVPIPGLEVSPFHLLGFKLITTRMPYEFAECACKQMGMRLAYPNFITQWIAAYVIRYGTFGSRPLAWIDSMPSQGQQQGCLAMRASLLQWNGPRIEAHYCFESLPVLCQGPIFANWNDIFDTLQMMDRLSRFLPGMEMMPPFFPLVREIMSTLGPLPNIPNLDQVLEMIFGGLASSSSSSSSSFSSSSSSSSSYSMNGSSSSQFMSGSSASGSSLMNESSSSSGMMKNTKESQKSIPPVAVKVNNVQVNSKIAPPSPRSSSPQKRTGSNDSPSGIMGIAQAIQGPLQSLLSNQLGSQVASQVVSQVASVVAGSLIPTGVPSQAISSLLSSLIPAGSMGLPVPIRLAEDSKPAIAAAVDILRIVSTESQTPSKACAALGFELGSYSKDNLVKVAEWAKSTKSGATFLDEQGFSHLVLPNGAVYHQLIKLARQSSTHAVCQVAKSQNRKGIIVA
jgi:hypothetical protein